MKRSISPESVLSEGFVSSIRINRSRIAKPNAYPFSLPALKSLERIDLNPRITFFIGENGSGKSTLVEAVAVAWGLNPEGGSRNFSFNTRASHSCLSDCMTLVKSPYRPRDAFFFRAESYFNLATEIERLDKEPWGGPPIIASYGNVSLHEQSHGESFLALLNKRFHGNGLYILDEPEAALSPTRQMAMITRIHQLIEEGCQFIIATHSPILMGYPNALIYELGSEGVRSIGYQETEHYAVTREFLNNTEGMLEILLKKQKRK